MKRILKIVGGTALGLACLAGTARAELVLSGSTAGWFQGSSSGDTEIVSTVDGSFASYRTGVPINDEMFKSGVSFESVDFANVHSGDSFGLGMITYYNGRTLVGTSSATALFDLYLDLSDPSLAPFKLTTITFGIDATVNDGSLVPDVFTASFTPPPAILIGDQLVKFSINDLPANTDVSENTWVQLANITVTFTPVPEPATYGMIASAGLLGLAAYRRFRGQKGSQFSGPIAAA